MIKYPDLDQPASNYNYPPPPQELQDVPVGIPPDSQWQNNQAQWVPPQGGMQQYSALPVTVFPNALMPSLSTMNSIIITYDKKRMPPCPLNIRCPECQGYITTKINYIPGCLSYSLCLSMCAIGLFCGCCLIPFCVNCCNREVHQCPLCESIIGDVK